MYLDQQTLLSDAQAITGDAVSTNTLDFGAAGDMGKGSPVKLLVQIAEDFDNLTSLNIKLESDDNSSFSTANVLAETGDISLNALKTGYIAALHVVPRGTERFLRLSYDVTGTAPNAGKVTAAIVADHQTNK
jgi:hypothetical protein